MKRRTLISITVLSSWLAGCGGVASSQDPIEELPQMVERINSGAVPPMIPSMFAGTTLSARVDHGDTLVLRYSNAPLELAAYNPNVIRKELRPQFCGHPLIAELVDAGGRVRMEAVTKFGRELPPIQIAHCWDNGADEEDAEA